MKRILITYATAGIGHKKAAIAIKKAFDELKFPGAEAQAITSPPVQPSTTSSATYSEP